MIAAWRLLALTPLLAACPKAPLPPPEVDAAAMDAPDVASRDVAFLDADALGDRVDVPAVDIPRPLFCPPPQRLCGVSCREIGSDPLHCGACGRACVLAAAIAGCDDGACTLAACREGFGNCDDVVANGCEIATASDPMHCAVCGNRCVFANAAATCVGGRCELGACRSGFLDCNGSAADGCETDGTTDAHCGTCLVVCPSPQRCARVGGLFVCSP